MEEASINPQEEPTQEPQMDPRLADESARQSLHHPAHPFDENPEDHIGELEEKDPWTTPVEAGWGPSTDVVEPDSSLVDDANKEEPNDE